MKNLKKIKTFFQNHSNILYFISFFHWYLFFSAQFLNGFTEKAELVGVDRNHFADAFERVPAEQLPSNLTPAFTHQFVECVVFTFFFIILKKWIKKYYN